MKTGFCKRHMTLHVRMDCEECVAARIAKLEEALMQRDQRIAKLEEALRGVYIYTSKLDRQLSQGWIDRIAELVEVDD